jgi:hypothetical protein
MVLILDELPVDYYIISIGISKLLVLNAVAEREVISLNSYFFWLLFPINIYFFYLAGREGLPQVYKRIGYPQKYSTY